jgi:hypothetical protein
MDLGTLNIGSLRWPGRAGKLQDERSTAALMAELGDNYASYNEWLAREANAIGSRPDPTAYDDPDDYARACAHVRDILAAEILLRQARGFRQLGRSLRDRDRSAPLVDGAHRLVSAETGRATLDVEGSAEARRWRHVPVPMA